MPKRARGPEEALAAAAAAEAAAAADLAAGAPLPPPKAPVVKNGGKCEHNREKRLCRECGGWAICEHNRRKSYCKECGGSAICEHSRQRSKCKDCGGAALRKCEHGKLKTSRCKRCREAGMCQHKQKRKRCSECAPFRDLGAVGIAVEAHELLSLLERSSLPYASHPRRAEIAEKMARLRAFAFSHAPAPVQPEQPPLPADDGPPHPPAPQMSQEQYQHMMAAPPNFPQFAAPGVHAMAGPPMPQAGGAQPGQAPHPFNPYYPPPWGFGNHLYQSPFPGAPVRQRREGVPCPLFFMLSPFNYPSNSCNYPARAQKLYACKYNAMFAAENLLLSSLCGQKCTSVF